MLVEFFQLRLHFPSASTSDLWGRGVFLDIFSSGFSTCTVECNIQFSLKASDHCKSIFFWGGGGDTVTDAETKKQCSWSETLRYRSGSVDQYHWITNPDPALFFKGFQTDNKIKFFLLFLLHLHQSSKITTYLDDTKLWKSRFFFFFL